ncbi:MAG: ATP-binding cassette domain-containing protein, partial [Kiritimatiellae bacterium]|nr:ATP-binding cassette domain-containing protein [Kiritimatiellia bacterium]
GGGKTTLLKLLLGLVEPHYGTVRVMGASPLSVRQRIGYVPQHFQFDARYPVSVRDVVLTGRIERRRFGPYRRDDRDAAATALERVGLAGLAGRAFAALSGGERQRVLVAQALASQPELLLLDEPTANVDSVVAQQLHALFASLAGEITVVLVSHNLSVVAAQATYIICVNRTAEMHVAEEMPHSHFRTAAGIELMLVQHDAKCHVIDATAALDAPHAGSPEAGRR